MRERTVGFASMLLCFLALGCGGGSNGGGSSGGGSTTPGTSEILFVNGGGLNSYSVDLSSGALTQVSTNSSAPGSADMVVTPNGKFLYFTNTPVAIVGYSVDASGNLTALPGSPFANPETNPFALVGLVVDAGGKFLYTSDPGQQNIVGYTIDSTTGALTAAPVTPLGVPRQIRQMAITPQGKFLYATDEFNSVVLGFSIDSSTGGLTAVAGSPFPVPSGNAGQDIIGVTSDPSGKFLYTANAQGIGLSGFTINQTNGALTDIPGSPYATGSSQFTQTCCVVVHPSGKFVYAIEQDAVVVAGFSVDSTSGALTPISGSPFAFPGQPNGAPSNANGPMLIDPSGQYMYVALGDLSLAVFKIDTSSGALKQAKEPLAPLPSAAQGLAIVTKQQ